MEDVLEVYRRPYNATFPVVCMDESSKQLVGEVTEPIPMASGLPLLKDDEYVRKGVADIFMAVEPLAGIREVKITERRTKIDFAYFVRDLVNGRYAHAKRIVLVMDNLNTHSTSSLYEAFSPKEALEIAKRLEIHFTPKHGSWLNVAEIELSVYKRQCLPERIPCIEEMRLRTDLQNSLKALNYGNNIAEPIPFFCITELPFITMKHMKLHETWLPLLSTTIFNVD